jgi:hypothetical protein
MVVVRSVPKVAPRGDSIIKSPPVGSGVDTIFDLECIAELIEHRSWADIRTQRLPIPQVVLNYRTKQSVRAKGDRSNREKKRNMYEVVPKRVMQHE